MPFEILEPATPSDAAGQDLTVAEAETGSRSSSSGQMTLHLYEARSLAPAKDPAEATPEEVHAHLANLRGQIDGLRKYLRERSAEPGRLAVLLRQMIEARERELDRWLAREANWDQRLVVIENAICERDAYRQREAELTRERDEAKRLAAATEAKLEAARYAAEQAKREAAAVRRIAERANAEQLRLRAEREMEQNAWASEKRQLAAKLERRGHGGWLSKLIGN